MVQYLAEQGSDSRAVSENLMPVHGFYGPSNQKPTTPTVQVTHRSASLLVDLKEVTEVDQVWATVLYIHSEGLPLAWWRLDCSRRNVLSWKLSNSLDMEFLLEALEMLLPVLGEIASRSSCR